VAGVDEGDRVALGGAEGEALVVGGGGQVSLEARDGAERVHLGHAPGVEDAQVVAPREAVDHRRRSGGAADDHLAQRGEVVRAGVLVEEREQAEPDGGHAGGAGDALGGDELDEGRRVEVRSGEDQLRAGERGGEGDAPRGGVEHGDHREQCVGLRDAEGVGHAGHQRVQRGRAVAVDDAFRVAGGAGGVADHRGGVLVERRPREGGGLGGEELLVVVLDDDGATEGGDARGEALEQRDEGAVDDDDAVLGVPGDVGELVGVKPEVEGVEHRPHGRDGEVRLEVLLVVPAQRRDAVPGPDAEPRERRGQTAATIDDVAVGGARERPVGAPRDDLARREEGAGALEEVGEREGDAHHEALHGGHSTASAFGARVPR
jgi:hypothetical protein